MPFTPFALGFALVHADGGTELFMDPAKLPEPTRAWLGNAVSVAGREALAPALARLAGKRVRVDPSGSPVWFAQTLREAGATVVAGPRPLPAAQSLQERGRTAGRAQRPCARCGGGVPLPALAGCDGAGRRRNGNVRRGEAAGTARGGGRVPRRELPGDLRRRRAWRDHPLPRHRGQQPADPAERGVSDRFRRAIPGRHHRHHPHRLDRPRRGAGASARTRHAGDEGAHRHRHRGVSRRASAARIWTPSRGGRCGRPGWTTTTAPATASAATCRCMRGRSASRAWRGRCRSPRA